MIKKIPTYRPAKLLRLNELPEVRLPSREAESMSALVRCRKPLGEDMVKLKNRVHAVLSLYGIHIHATDMFGRNGLKEIEKASSRLSAEERFVLDDLLLRINELKFGKNTLEEEEISRLVENNDRVGSYDDPRDKRIFGVHNSS